MVLAAAENTVDEADLGMKASHYRRVVLCFQFVCFIFFYGPNCFVVKLRPAESAPCLQCSENVPTEERISIPKTLLKHVRLLNVSEL